MIPFQSFKPQTNRIPAGSFCTTTWILSRSQTNEEDFSSIANLEIESRIPVRSDDFIKKLRGTASQHEAEEVWLISYADLMTLLMGFFALLLSFSEFKEENFEKVKEQTSEFFGGEYAVPFENFAEKLRKFSQDQNITDQFAVENGPSGVIISFRGSLVFESAGTALNEKGQQILSKVLPIIKKDSTEFTVIVEGHTDNVPITTHKVRNNWDLSGLRASTVATVFENLGFDRKDIHLAAMADTRPVAPNNDENGQPIPENQAKNRRVVIKLIPKNKKTNNQSESEIIEDNSSQEKSAETEDSTL